MITQTMSTIDQLIKIYFTEEPWHENKLSYEESAKYFSKLIEKSRLVIQEVNDEIVGYGESWRLSYEQLGRIICKAGFSAYVENVETGPVCYLANTWIKEEYRDRDVLKQLRYKFLEQNKSCEYYVGDARRKKTGLIKVFTNKKRS